MGALAGCASHGGQPEPPPTTTTTDVVGTMRTTCHEATGDVDRPVDASKRLVQAFVPDTSPAGYHLVNGTGNADGSFVLHDVPADATYVLQIDTSVSGQLTYFVTDQRMLDVRFEHQGRCVPSPAVASATFGISTAVTNASPFSFQLDEVALDSFKLGFGVLATSAGVQEDVDGLKASLSWPRNFLLVDAAAGDDLYVLHNRTDQSTDSATGAGVTTQHIVDWFDATGMTFQDAQPASITGAFQSTTSIPSAAQTGTLSVALGPFESLYDGTTRPGRFTVQLLAQPGGGLGFDGFGSAVLLGITLGPAADGPLTATYTTHYSYADPFPASWKRAITVDSQRSHLVRLSTDPASALGVITGYHQQIAYTDALQIAPPALRRPTGITVGGVDFTRGGKVAFDGQSPVVIRWAPVAGAQLYQFTMVHVPQAANSFVVNEAIVSTSSTSLTLPAALFETGTRYQFILKAIQTPVDYRAGQLMPPRLPLVSTGVPSGRFRFLPSCGDGVVQPGEDCDTGRESATCNEDCTTAMCGDGVVNAAAGEQCDAINKSVFCTTACKLP
jgi:hypothetical protein